MKKIKLLVITFICLFVVNVKADMGPPMIIQHDVMVTNKDGAQCYEYDDNAKFKKTDTVIPYKTTLSVSDDIDGSYIRVYSDSMDEYSCMVKYSDVSAKTQSFSLSTKDVEKITAVKAVVLAKGGLNMRKGPSVTYAKTMTIPEHAVITLTHQAGTFWYYATYNGKSGWITSMNKYIGIEDNHVLISPTSTNIYDSKMNKVLGKIPANTGISDYLVLNTRLDVEGKYYVNYNGTKGYIQEMFHKIDSPGKIKLVKDFIITEDENGTPLKKITAGKEFEYTMVDDDLVGSIGLYIPEKKDTLYFGVGDIEYITKANISIKKSGFIGEGLFGEKKDNYKIEDDPTVDPIIDPTPTTNGTDVINDDHKDEPNKSMSTKDIIIICLLGGIFLALTAIVVIKLLNGKKKEIKKEPVQPRNDIEEARMTIEKRINSEEKNKVKFDEELEKMKSVDNDK